jgi:putative membrane-bound dehydrogenase-like protein
MRRPVLGTRYSVLSTLLLAASALGCASRLTAADRPVPTKDAAARMTVPEGFRVTLFAGEPAVVQPIAMTFDDRGRLWVVECLSYPKWRADGKGNDRVTILEDTDGDGTHDKRTVFLDNGSNLSGIELGFGGVWLCSLPNLIFVPDKDRDDKPDGPPEVLLDGWNLKDTKHNVFNSLGWGPDGWLYGCNGIQARSKVGKPGTPEKDRTYMDCGVWRYHPTRKAFEVVAHGTTNPFGLDWDEHGELFITNCVIDHLWHVVPGGHYRRMYGQDVNPYVFDLMGPASDHKHWGGGHWTTARADQKTGAVQKAHDDAGGGHAHSGCCVYLGDNFPPEYRNSVFMCNIHGNRLNRDTLHRQGFAYVGKHAPDFLNANDPWFRGICIKQGPEGALYVSDWCDTGECHNYEVADTTNGRIYRVAYGTPKPIRGDVSKMTDEELAYAAVNTNEWLSRKARRVLQERKAVGAEPLLRKLGQNRDPNVKLRAVWALHAIGRWTPTDTARGLGSGGGFRTNRPDISWAIRLTADEPTAGELFSSGELGRFTDEQMDPSDRINVALRVPPKEARKHLIRIMEKLAAPSGKGGTALKSDEFWLRYWYAVTRAADGDPDWMFDLLAVARSSRIREYASRWYITTAKSEELNARLERFFQRAAEARCWERSGPVLHGVWDAVSDRKSLLMPPSWPKMLAIANGDGPEAERAVLSLGLLFNDPATLDRLRIATRDKSARPEDRSRAIDLLAGRRDANFGAALRNLITDPAVRSAAIRALAAYPDAETPAAVLKHYPQFTTTEKADAVQTLASRPAFAQALLDAVENGAVPKSDITAFAARQIQTLNDKNVSDRLAKVWGTVRPASATRTAQAEKYKTLLTPDRLKAADLSNGRAVFAKHCASCHKLFGEGGDVGPELTGSQRANLDYVLENVLDPSAVVPGEYRMTAFTLLDGRTLTGIVRRETPQAVTVRTVNEEITVPVADLDARKPTALSVMPDGLFDALKEDEVRDLVAYLASPRQVPPTGAP